MTNSNTLLLSLAALMLSFSVISYAEPVQPSTGYDELYAQVQQLKTQMSAANQKITELERQQHLENEMSKMLFADSSEKLHGRNR